MAPPERCREFGDECVDGGAFGRIGGAERNGDAVVGAVVVVVVVDFARAANRAGVRLENPFFDTYRYAKQFQAAQGWSNVRLETLSRRFGIEQNQAHRAWCDAEANVNVYFKLKELD